MARETLSAGRNELCPCGSGRKYKRCCAVSEAEKSDVVGSFFGVAAAITGIMVIVAIIAFARSLLEEPAQRVWSAEHGHWHTVRGGKEVEDSSTPGPNKVWSEEHGHYHTTGGSAEGGPGKVWNEEHGHYHDASGGVVEEHQAPVANPLDDRRRHMIDEAAKKAEAGNGH